MPDIFFILLVVQKINQKIKIWLSPARWPGIYGQKRQLKKIVQWYVYLYWIMKNKRAFYQIWR